MLAKEDIELLITKCQQALNELNKGDKRRAVGLIDEVEFDAEGVKWLLINQIIIEEGKF